MEKALEGKNAIMTTVIRGSNGPTADGGSTTGGYSWTIGEAPLEKVGCGYYFHLLHILTQAAMKANNCNNECMHTTNTLLSLTITRWPMSRR